MLLYLDLAAIICFVLFVINLIIRLHHIRKTGNYSNAGKFTIVFNWLLIIVFFISISGIAYGASRPTQFQALCDKIVPQQQTMQHQQTSASSTSHHSTKKTTSHKKTSSFSSSKQVTWSPTQPTITGGTARVRFLVPANTKLVVQGHLHHQRYGAVPASSQKQDVTLKFTDSGEYDVIATKSGNTTTQHMTINY